MFMLSPVWFFCYCLYIGKRCGPLEEDLQGEVSEAGNVTSVLSVFQRAFDPALLLSGVLLPHEQSECFRCFPGIHLPG